MGVSGFAQKLPGRGISFGLRVIFCHHPEGYSIYLTCSSVYSAPIEFLGKAPALPQVLSDSEALASTARKSDCAPRLLLFSLLGYTLLPDSPNAACAHMPLLCRKAGALVTGSVRKLSASATPPACLLPVTSSDSSLALYQRRPDAAPEGCPSRHAFSTNDLTTLEG
jgi:hypothetical protein